METVEVVRAALHVAITLPHNQSKTVQQIREQAKALFGEQLVAQAVGVTETVELINTKIKLSVDRLHKTTQHKQDQL